MKKTTLFLTAFFAANLMLAQPSVSEVWKIDATTDIPAKTGSPVKNFIGTANNCRGMAAGRMGSNEYVFVISREGGSIVHVLEAATGLYLKDLNMTGVSGGKFDVNDGALTDDGILLVSNMVMPGEFKVYRWDNLDDAPTEAIKYNIETGRFGDKISVTGKISDGSARVYIASFADVAGMRPVLYFDMESDPEKAGSFRFVGTPKKLVDMEKAKSGSNPIVYPSSDGGFYYKANGTSILKYSGTPLALTSECPLSVVATAGNTPRCFASDENNDYLCYYKSGVGAEQAVFLKVSKATLEEGNIIISTPILGTTENLNASSGLSIVKEGNDYAAYVLSTNNGIGKYLVKDLVPTSLTGVSKDKIKMVVDNQTLSVSGIASADIELFNVLGNKVKSISDGNAISTKGLSGVHIVLVKSNGKTIYTGKVILK